MPYAELLSKKIEEKEFSIKEVALKCKEYGQNITASYISIIKNPDNKKIPSDEVSRALAKVLEVNENLFVMEAYADKAPEEFKVFFEDYKALIAQSITMVYSNAVTNEEMDTVLINLEHLPIAELILLSSSLKQSFSKMEGGFNTITKLTDENSKIIMELKEPAGIPVTDDSMFPILQKGSEVTLEAKDNYENGDILCFIKGKSKEMIFRKCFYANEKKTKLNFISINSNLSETLDIKDVKILGRVKRIIKNIN